MLGSFCNELVGTITDYSTKNGSVLEKSNQQFVNDLCVAVSLTMPKTRPCPSRSRKRTRKSLVMKNLINICRRQKKENPEPSTVILERLQKEVNVEP